MANSVISLIFPIAKNSQGQKHNKHNSDAMTSSHVTAVGSINLTAMHKRLFAVTNKTTNEVVEDTSMFALTETNTTPGLQSDSESMFGLLISDPTSNLESSHLRNLLFQSALTTAVNKPSYSTTLSKVNGTVTIITPQRWR